METENINGPKHLQNMENKMRNIREGLWMPLGFHGNPVNNFVSQPDELEVV